jgi:hypothetical protein
MVTIQLDSDKNYTAKEVVELTRLALDFIGEQGADSDLQYAATDVYWILRNLLDYVNQQAGGEFTLKRLRKGSWGLEYNDKTSAKRKADDAARQEIKRTTEYLKQLKTRRSTW